MTEVARTIPAPACCFFLTRLSSFFFCANQRSPSWRAHCRVAFHPLRGACPAAFTHMASIFPVFLSQPSLAARVLMEYAEVALARHDTALDNEVVKQVLGYFVRNPRTADTLEGIARWRLLEERVQKSLLQTEAAIDWLVGEKYLEEVTVAGSKEAIFRLNPERRSDAAASGQEHSRPGTREKLKSPLRSLREFAFERNRIERSTKASYLRRREESCFRPGHKGHVSDGAKLRQYCTNEG